LGQVSKTKERVIRLLYTKFGLGIGVSDHDNEEKVADNVPVKIVEIRWIGIVNLANDGSSILNKRITSHDVEQ
jgi:hypothetical protein